MAANVTVPLPGLGAVILAIRSGMFGFLRMGTPGWPRRRMARLTVPGPGRS